MHGRWLQVALALAAVVAGVWLAFRSEADWLFRLHLRQMLRPAEPKTSLSLVPGISPAVLRQIVRHSDDYHAQLAARLLLFSQTDGAQSLTELLPRFGDRPELIAHILRRYGAKLNECRPEASLRQMRIPVRLFEPLPGAPATGGPLVPQMQNSLPSAVQRIWQEWDLYNLWLRPFVPPLPSHTEWAYHRLSEQQVSTFIRLAKQGERLDPDNAFFPTALAAAYLHHRQDEAAIAALLRASRKARWNDYATDVSRSMLRLHQLVVGAYPALNRMQLLFYGSGHETWSPNWVARTAVYLAYLSDLDGDTRRGAEIRLALLRLGRLMRTQARTGRTATTGLAFTYIGSRVRPELYVEGFSRKDPSQERARQFAEYLLWAGRAQEIVWAEKELRAASTAHSILHNGSQKTSFLDPLLAQTGSGWYASFYYLTLGVIMLCLWAAVTFTARVSRLPRWLRYTAPGIVLVLLLTWLWHRQLLWLAVELKINAGYFADSNGYPSLGPVGEWIDYLRQKLWHWEADVDNLKPVCLARLGSLAFAVLSDNSDFGAFNAPRASRWRGDCGRDSPCRVGSRECSLPVVCARRNAHRKRRTEGLRSAGPSHLSRAAVLRTVAGNEVAGLTTQQGARVVLAPHSHCKNSGLLRFFGFRHLTRGGRRYNDDRNFIKRRRTT